MSPRTEKTPEPSLEGFRDFAKSKPADERYNYWSDQSCACAQYVGSAGIDWRVSRTATGIWPEAQVAAHGYGNPEDWTFGALADRLDALLASGGAS